jgi:hypothetical protein
MPPAAIEDQAAHRRRHIKANSRIKKIRLSTPSRLDFDEVEAREDVEVRERLTETNVEKSAGEDKDLLGGGEGGDVGGEGKRNSFVDQVFTLLIGSG